MRFFQSSIYVLTSSFSWRDIDAYNAPFMTPSRLNALKILLSRSLLTLNAPYASMNGVTRMAAWLNQPQAVRALLELSAESVSVDGIDSYGATALMCE